MDASPTHTAAAAPRSRALRRLAPALLAGVVALGCARAADERPNVVLITLDTTRPDHLGCYGYARATSPHLDALAGESVVYERAYSTSSWTLPAHASLFTGRFPKSHGARYDPEGNLVITSALDGPPEWSQYRARGISVDETTLAGVLAERGYRTAAFVAGPWMKRVFGLDKGFEVYDDSGISEANGRIAADVTRAATAWLEQPEHRPFLLFLNYYDPHSPHRPPSRYREMFVPEGQRLEQLDELEGLRAVYDAEIRYMDEHVGVLLRRLRELDVFDSSWIVVTADHGELLGENGLKGHGRYLTEAEIRVPLLVKPPRAAGVAPGRNDTLVQLTDVVPHLLQGLDVPVPASVQGGALGSQRNPVVAETYPLPIMNGLGDWQAIVAGPYKLAWNSEGDHYLVDVLTDPGEAHDLLGELPARAAELEAGLHGFLDALPPPGAAGPQLQIDPELQRTLEALGYLGHEDGE